MSDGRLNRIHAREVTEHRRAALYLAALAIAVLAVVTALALAFAAIAQAVR